MPLSSDVLSLQNYVPTFPLEAPIPLVSAYSLGRRAIARWPFSASRPEGSGLTPIGANKGVQRQVPPVEGPWNPELEMTSS
jgi:hypothetical protein